MKAAAPSPELRSASPLGAPCRLSLAMTSTCPAEPAATESKACFSAVVPARSTSVMSAVKMSRRKSRAVAMMEAQPFSGVWGRGGSEEQAVYVLPVAAVQTVETGRNGHCLRCPRQSWLPTVPPVSSSLRWMHPYDNGGRRPQTPQFQPQKHSRDRLRQCYQDGNLGVKRKPG